MALAWNVDIIVHRSGAQDDMDGRASGDSGGNCTYLSAARNGSACQCVSESSAGRMTPFETAGHAAPAGTFGYETDITKLPEEESKMTG